MNIEKIFVYKYTNLNGSHPDMNIISLEIEQKSKVHIRINYIYLNRHETEVYPE